jgi:hypothetical protein
MTNRELTSLVFLHMRGAKTTVPDAGSKPE